MATLQHAFARGLEVTFQLEESEVLTEPVPSRDKRNGILLFEATEGGAGVLGRLTSDPDALLNVASFRGRGRKCARMKPSKPKN